MLAGVVKPFAYSLCFKASVVVTLFLKIHVDDLYGLLANVSNKGTMLNKVDDLLILRKLCVNTLHLGAPKINSVTWSLPEPFWLKVNNYKATLGSIGIAGGGSVFRNSRSFVKSCFAVSYGLVAYAF